MDITHYLFIVYNNSIIIFIAASVMQLISLWKLTIISILAPKRSRWICLENHYFFVSRIVPSSPLFSPDLFFVL